jgi:hypothetical protein
MEAQLRGLLDVLAKLEVKLDRTQAALPEANDSLHR